MVLAPCFQRGMINSRRLIDKSIIWSNHNIDLVISGEKRTGKEDDVEPEPRRTIESCPVFDRLRATHNNRIWDSHRCSTRQHGGCEIGIRIWRESIESMTVISRAVFSTKTAAEVEEAISPSESTATTRQVMESLGSVGTSVVVKLVPVPAVCPFTAGYKSRKRSYHLDYSGRCTGEDSISWNRGKGVIVAI